MIPKIIYHMGTYEVELVRSPITNWLLAECAAQDVNMIMTGEGLEDIFFGYIYSQGAEYPHQIQDKLRRIYGMLGNINLHQTN